MSSRSRKTKSAAFAYKGRSAKPAASAAKQRFVPAGWVYSLDSELNPNLKSDKQVIIQQQRAQCAEQAALKAQAKLDLSKQVCIYAWDNSCKFGTKKCWRSHARDAALMSGLFVECRTCNNLLRTTAPLNQQLTDSHVTHSAAKPCRTCYPVSRHPCPGIEETDGCVYENECVGKLCKGCHQTMQNLRSNI